MNRPLFISYVNRIDRKIMIDNASGGIRVHAIEIPQNKSIRHRILYFNEVSGQQSYLLVSILFNGYLLHYKPFNGKLHTYDMFAYPLGTSAFTNVICEDMDTRIFPTTLLFDNIENTMMISNRILMISADKLHVPNITVLRTDDVVSKYTEIKKKTEQGLIPSFPVPHQIDARGYYIVCGKDGRYIYDSDGMQLYFVDNQALEINVLNVPESHPVFIKFKEQLFSFMKEHILLKPLSDIVAHYI